MRCGNRADCVGPSPSGGAGGLFPDGRRARIACGYRRDHCAQATAGCLGRKSRCGAAGNPSRTAADHCSPESRHCPDWWDQSAHPVRTTCAQEPFGRGVAASHSRADDRARRGRCLGDVAAVVSRAHLYFCRPFISAGTCLSSECAPHAICGHHNSRLLCFCRSCHAIDWSSVGGHVCAGGQSGVAPQRQGDRHGRSMEAKNKTQPRSRRHWRCQCCRRSSGRIADDFRNRPE